MNLVREIAEGNVRGSLFVSQMTVLPFKGMASARLHRDCHDKTAITLPNKLPLTFRRLLTRNLV